MRGLYASVILETKKHEKYATEIRDLRRRVAEAESQQRLISEHLDDIRHTYQEHIEQIKLLEKFIRERRDNTFKRRYDR